MNNADRNKILKMAAMLAVIVVVAGGLTRLGNRNSMSLTDYVKQNASPGPEGSPPPGTTSSSSEENFPSEEASPAPSSPAPDASSSESDASGTEGGLSSLTGASLNGVSQLERRTTYTEGFYFEPISDRLRRYMTGVSYPAEEPGDGPEDGGSPAGDAEEGGSPTGGPGDGGSPADGAEDGGSPAGGISEDGPQAVSFEELRYVHIWHYDFSGKPVEGELICNEYIAQDLVEIFYELYRNEYRLEEVALADEYDGDWLACLEADNTFCFCGSPESEAPASRYARGLAVAVNPLYNPYVSYGQDGAEEVIPAGAAGYADRSKSFAYKIDEEDLCCRLFLRHGFVWGGNRNDAKSYMQFYKTAP